MRKFIIFFIVIVVVVGGVMAYQKGIFPEGKPTSTDAVIMAIRSRGQLVVGTDATYPPMELVDNSGNIVGFDAELAEQFAKHLGVRLVMKNISFDSIFDAVAAGSIDLAMSSISITPERTGKVLFSNPYLNAGQVVVVAKTNTTVATIDDLRGKKIAAQVDTTSLKEAQKITDKGNVIVYASDYNDVVAKLVSGTIDAIIMDFPAAVNLAHDNIGTKVVGRPFTSEFYGIATKKGNAALIAEINQKLADLKKGGVLADLEQKWLK